MLINSAANSTVGTFKFHTNNQDRTETESAKVDNKTAHSAKTSAANGGEKVTTANPVRWKLIELETSKIVNESSIELHDRLEALFKEGSENTITGKSTDEFKQHINDLTAAIEGQDFKNAEKIIDKIYSGDKEEIVNKVKSMAESVANGFWNKLRDRFKDMVVTDKFTIYENGEKPDKALPYVLNAIEKAKAASADLAVDGKTLADRVTSSLTEGVESSKNKLDNAGQNRYSENAESVIGAAVVHARENIFGGNKNAFAESEEELENVNDRINENFGNIPDNVIDEYDKETRRKDDDFSKYVRKGGDEFIEAIKKEMGNLKLAKEEETTRTNALSSQRYHNEGPHETPILVPIDLTRLSLQIATPETHTALMSPLKATELYMKEEKEQGISFGFQKKETENINRII